MLPAHVTLCLLSNHKPISMDMKKSCAFKGRSLPKIMVVEQNQNLSISNDYYMESASSLLAACMYMIADYKSLHVAIRSSLHYCVGFVPMVKGGTDERLIRHNAPSDHGLGHTLDPSLQCSAQYAVHAPRRTCRIGRHIICH